MIYDNTDTKANLKDLRYLLPEDQNLLDIDEIDYEIPFGLTQEWTVGGKLYRALRWIDKCKGFSSWDDALAWIDSIGQKETIEQIQVWGHGSPGKSWIGKQYLGFTAFEFEHSEVLKSIASNMTQDGVIWFRNCGVFSGKPGHRFAKAWANNMGCTIAAHTYIIGLWQAGLNTCKPGEEPSWPLDEGIALGTPSRPLKLKNSMPWSEKVGFVLRASIPGKG